MKNLLLLLLLVASNCLGQVKEIGNLSVRNVPEIPSATTDLLERYNNIRSASLSGILRAESGMLIVTRFGETNQVHLVKTPMGTREQITFDKEPINGGSICPDTTRNGFIFSRDIGGSENFQLYYFNLKDRSRKLLTDGKSRNGSARWNFAGTKIAYTSNRNNPADMDIYVSTLDAPESARVVLQCKGGGWSITDWSRDDKRMILREGISVNRSNLYLFELESGELTLLNDSSKIISYGSAFFNAAGTGIFIESDEGREFSYLRYYDLMKNSYNWSLPDLKWDIDGVTYNLPRTKIIFSLNANGYSEMYTLDPATFKHEKMKGFPEGIIGNYGFSTDNKKLYFSYSASNQPADVYEYDLTSAAIQRWTKSETGDMDPKSFVSCSTISYPTFDKVDGKPRMVPALLYKPEAKAGKKHPVLISIHGGPESQSKPSFNPNTQHYVRDLGFAVLVPNVRGSTGYGKTYTTLDNGFLRLDAVKDIGALLDWIATQPDLDADRVAVMGGSYGGTMVLMCMTELGDRIRCGVDLFGSSNLVTFLKNTSSYRRDLRRVEYGDERDPEMEKFLQKIAPLNHLEKFTKPIFIYQGKNDPRVPLSESDQIVDALDSKGKPVWYVMAKDEGHGLAKKVNREYTYAAISMFLMEFLGK